MKIATVSTNQHYELRPEAKRKPAKSEDLYSGLTGKALMAKQYIDSIGLTDEVLEETMKKYENQSPTPARHYSQQEIIEDYFNFIFEQLDEIDERDRTIRQLQTTLAEKDKLIADLQEKLKLAEQKLLAVA